MTLKKLIYADQNKKNGTQIAQRKSNNFRYYFRHSNLTGSSGTIIYLSIPKVPQGRLYFCEIFARTCQVVAFRKNVAPLP